MAKLLNIAANSLKGRNFTVMTGKVMRRFSERGNESQKQTITAWCKQHQEPLEPFLKNLDPALFEETEKTCTQIKQKAQQKLSALGMDLGGGGNYPLLYFFTRYLKPQNILETGVAAGWSSQAILTALKTNDQNAHLYSSDFPYFRYKNPEKLVGYIVDDSLKTNWTLMIDGDENNIPALLKALKPGKIDLFHYDSDKSYAGRENAYKAVQPALNKNALIIYDDIQDNAHFMDWVAKENRPFKVFEFEGKYIGLTGTIPA
ncbi:MAG: class I SAM-dependent methyltransferase [Alphaproteobacteria bacterium]